MPFQATKSFGLANCQYRLCLMYYVSLYSKVNLAEWKFCIKCKKCSDIMKTHPEDKKGKVAK